MQTNIQIDTKIECALTIFCIIYYLQVNAEKYQHERSKRSLAEDFLDSKYDLDFGYDCNCE